MQVLLQVLTLFLLMMCGLLAVKSRLMKEQGVSGLNTLVLYFAQPSLIVSSMQQDANPQLIRDLAWVLACTCAIMAVSGVIAHRVFKKEAPQRRSVLTNLSMASNCGFMGYPVITAALGEDALIYAVIYVIGFQLMSWTLSAYYFGGRQAMKPKELLKNPSLLAVVLGLVLFLTGWRLPSFINNGLSMLGATTTPLAMFVIGARLMGLKKEHLGDKSLLLTCLMRLIAFPLLVLLMRYLPVSDMVVSSVYLCTAMPCAALTAMMSELYRCDKELASRGVALSTAFSLITIPLMLLLV